MYNFHFSHTWLYRFSLDIFLRFSLFSKMSYDDAFKYRWNIDSFRMHDYVD